MEGLEGAPKIKQGIRGRLTDADTGEAIMEGQVQVIDKSKKVLTDLDGYYAIELPPGTYALRAFYELYEASRVDHIEVKRGQVTEVDIKLSHPKDAVIEEIVVTARADKATEATQLQVRKESAAVRDSISAQEISRSGSNNAADAVRRVVSATVDPNNRLIVRGLGSRYTRVLLHGFLLPSTDPDDPGVELDLFPSGILSNLSVVKTFTPDLPGDFAGGIMQIETREFPQKFLLQVNGYLGYNSETTGRDVLDYKGGKTDWLGFDDGTRALPSDVPTDTPVTSRVPPNATEAPLTDEQVVSIGRSFKNNYGITSRTALPTGSLSMVVGDTVKLGKHDLGYLGAFGYTLRPERRISTITQAPETTLPDGSQGLDPSQATSYRDDRGRQIATFGALGTISLELSERSDLTLTSLFSQSGSREVNFAEGTTFERLLEAQRRLRFIQRQIFFSQLRGQHRELPRAHKLTIDWNASVAHAARDEPDTRLLRYARVDAKQPYEWVGGSQRSPLRFFSDLGEWVFGSQLDLQLPIVDAVKLKAGGRTRNSFGELRARRFYFQDAGATTGQKQLGPDRLFAPENIGVIADFHEGTQDTDGYDATTQTYAGYAMAEIAPVKPLRLIGGTRVEHFRQDLKLDSPTFVVDTAPMDRKSHQKSTNLLPAGSVIYEVVKDMFVRASYGKTVARPMLREVAPALYEDDIRRFTVAGNPRLKPAQIHNVDLRWELFPGTNEVLAVTGFYKKFIDPVEPYQFGNSSRSFQNAKGADNAGAELETRLSLGRISDALSWFQAGANFTYSWSRIEIDRSSAYASNNTSTKRPLAGLSPYVANLSLGFSEPSSGSSLFVYYNVFGKRIDQVGTDGLPDLYEQPFHSLDLIGSYNVDKHWSLRLTARNLLLQSTRIKQGPIMRERFNPGSTVLLGAAWTY